MSAIGRVTVQVVTAPMRTFGGCVWVLLILIVILGVLGVLSFRYAPAMITWFSSTELPTPNSTNDNKAVSPTVKPELPDNQTKEVEELRKKSQQEMKDLRK